MMYRINNEEKFFFYIYIYTLLLINDTLIMKFQKSNLNKIIIKQF